MRSRAEYNNNNRKNDLSSSTDDLFSECVTGLLMETEELRRSLDDVLNAHAASMDRHNKHVVQMHHLVQWQHALERLLPLLDQLARLTDDMCAMTMMMMHPNDKHNNHQSNNNNNNNNNHHHHSNAHMDLFQHCQDKVLAIAQHVLESSFRWHEPTEEDHFADSNDNDAMPLDVFRQDGQAAIARLTELNLILLAAAAADPSASPQPTNRGGVGGGGGAKNPPARDEDTSRQDTASIIQSYVAYQRKVLRLRAKPAIARLVQSRQTDHAIMSLTQPHVNHHEDEFHDDDEPDMTASSNRAPLIPQHHAPVLAVILGQAAALIHPLLVWQANLPADAVVDQTDMDAMFNGTTNVVRSIRQLCTESVNILDEQAQSLTKTVCDWFAEDRPIDKWMQLSAAAATDQEYSTTTENENDAMDRDKLRLLDGLVEEMAFVCELMARYQALVQAHQDSGSSCSSSSGGTTTNHSVIANELLPEWTWKYATLERFLALQQWQSARSLASPVHTVIGTDIQVPSVVEDAHYLSTRALERAASTQSHHAIGTVAHSVSRDIWSTEVTGGVYQALIDKMGCWVEPKQQADASAKTAQKLSSSSSTTTPPLSGFASALLDALDEDLQSVHRPPPSSSLRNGGAPTSRSSGPPSAPSSGNFLTALVSGVGGTANEKLQQMQMETDFCVLNGIHASSGACRSLVALLDSLLLEDEGQEQSTSERQTGKTVAMIQLAREELFQYAESYHSLLQARIQEALETWCGAGPEDPSGLQQALAFHNLRQFLVRETYQLDADSFAAAEADERLEREYMKLFYDCRFWKEMADRCEADVLRQVGKQSIAALVSLFLDVLWNTDKRFTDWGSLLLSKQIRLMQTFVSECLTSKWSDARTPNLLHGWERLSHVLTILQLEKPSDWLMYNFDPSALPLNELQRTMCLRVDFSVDAVQAVVTQVSAKLTTAHPKTSTTV